jgi:hypothetical protein
VPEYVRHNARKCLPLCACSRHHAGACVARAIACAEQHHADPSHIHESHRTATKNTKTNTTVEQNSSGISQGTALVKEVGEAGVALAWSSWQEPAPPAPITLLLAMPRPRALKRLWRQIPELGVKQVVRATPRSLRMPQCCQPLWAPMRCRPGQAANSQQDCTFSIPVRQVYHLPCALTLLRVNERCKQLCLGTLHPALRSAELRKFAKL